MKPLRIALAILLGLFVLARVSEAASVSRLELSGELYFTDQAYSLELACAEVDAMDHPVELFGHSTASPPCILAKFEVTLGSHSIDVPRAAYIDLANPTLPGGLGIIETEHYLTIHIKGGDGENSYEAEFQFSNSRFERRKVTTWNEFGDPVVNVLEGSPQGESSDSQ